MFSRIKTFVSSLGKAFKGFKANGKPSGRHFLNRARLGLEQLEDRSVPAVLTVTTNADAGAGSLRATLAMANDGDTVNFAPALANQTITLTTGQIPIEDTLTIDGAALNITISGNNASRIFYVTDASLTDTINNLRFMNGRSPVNEHGGAILTIGQLILNNDWFLNNVSSRSGGAVYASWFLTAGGNVTMTGCHFWNNTAGTYGGAVSVYSRNLTLDLCDFSNNTAVLGGGAVFTSGNGQTTTVRNRTIFSNNRVTGTGEQAFYYGGALQTTQRLSVSNSDFLGNSAANGGGAIYYFASGTSGSLVTIYDSTFDTNSGLKGGGVLLWVNISGGTVTAKVNGCLFRNNHAEGFNDGDGGGMYVLQQVSGNGICIFQLTNSTFYQNNSGYWGGGIFLKRNVTGQGVISTKLVSLTVTRNSAGFAGGGVYIMATNGNPDPSFGNNIIGGNMLTFGGPFDGKDVKGTVNTLGYNLVGIQEGSAGWFVINQNDLLGTNANPLNPGLDPAGPTSNGGPTETIRLLDTSPGYRTGDPGLWFDPDPINKDQRGYLRQQGSISRGAYDPDAVEP